MLPVLHHRLGERDHTVRHGLADLDPRLNGDRPAADPEAAIVLLAGERHGIFDGFPV
jgi:hypothetical protein